MMVRDRVNRSREVPTSPTLGYVDEAHLTGFSGWIRGLAERPGVGIRLNGYLAARIPATVRRDDVKAAQIGSGAVGFAGTWDVTCLEDREVHVEFIDGDGGLLTHGAWKVAEGSIGIRDNVGAPGGPLTVQELVRFSRSIKPLGWLDTVAANLAQQWADLDDEGLVWFAYKSLLGRNVDAHGLEASLAALDGAGILARRALVTRLLESEECEAKAASARLAWVVGDAYGLDA